MSLNLTHWCFGVSHLVHELETSYQCEHLYVLNLVIYCVKVLIIIRYALSIYTESARQYENLRRNSEYDIDDIE